MDDFNKEQIAYLLEEAQFKCEFAEAVCRKMEERGYGISLLQETILEVWYGITDADGEIWDSKSAEEYGLKFKTVTTKCFGTLYGGYVGSFGDFGSRFPSKAYKKLSQLIDMYEEKASDDVISEKQIGEIRFACKEDESVVITAEIFCKNSDGVETYSVEFYDKQTDMYWNNPVAPRFSSLEQEQNWNNLKSDVESYIFRLKMNEKIRAVMLKNNGSYVIL